jgi:glyoxylase-like metal-dependent hydrolase (beta-lactamase superfamily II)
LGNDLYDTLACIRRQNGRTVASVRAWDSPSQDVAKETVMLKPALLCSLLLVAVPALGHKPMNMAELKQAFGWDFSNVEIRTETVAPGLHVLFGRGGNVAVLIGEQGALVVDSQFPELVPKIKAAINQLGGGDVNFAVNTHWHFDHADGNPVLGEGGTWMVSQLNSRRMMVSTQVVNMVRSAYEQPPYPAEGLPIITFNDRMQFHFNGQRIDLMHFGPAHTAGDTAVFFRGANAVHTGDVFNNTGYPFIDADNGGDIDGMIAFCQAMLEQLNADSIVIPGHGAVASYADLADFTNMLRTVRGRIARLLDQGMTLEQVIAAKPTAEFDDHYGDPSGLIDRAYSSLTK